MAGRASSPVRGSCTTSSSASTPGACSILNKNFPTDWRSEEPPGSPGWYLEALYSYFGGALSATVRTGRAMSAMRFPEVPRLTADGVSCFMYFDSLPKRPGVALGMQLQTGDVQFMNNFVTVQTWFGALNLDRAGERMHPARVNGQDSVRVERAGRLSDIERIPAQQLDFFTRADRGRGRQVAVPAVVEHLSEPVQDALASRPGCNMRGAPSRASTWWESKSRFTSSVSWCWRPGDVSPARSRRRSVTCSRPSRSWTSSGNGSARTSVPAEAAACAAPSRVICAVQAAVEAAGRGEHAPNAMDNFCFEVTLGYRRLERPRRVHGNS
jgi:hypothetical protein